MCGGNAPVLICLVSSSVLLYTLFITCRVHVLCVQLVLLCTPVPAVYPTKQQLFHHGCGSQAGYEMEELYTLPWARVHIYIQEADGEESVERTKL